MSKMNINDLMSNMINNNENLQELNEQEVEKIRGGTSVYKPTKPISMPVDPISPGGAGCPACLSGYDPRYDQLA